MYGKVKEENSITSGPQVNFNERTVKLLNDDPQRETLRSKMVVWGRGRWSAGGGGGWGSQGRGLSHTKIQFYKNIGLVMRNSRWVTLVAGKNLKKPACSWLVPRHRAASHAPGQWEKSTPLCTRLSPSPPFTFARHFHLRSFSLREGIQRFLPIRGSIRYIGTRRDSSSRHV